MMTDIERRTREAIYRKNLPGIGELSIRPFVVKDDAKNLHRWVNEPYARYWGMQGQTLSQVQEAYTELVNRRGYGCWTGTLNGEQVFLMESYDPQADRLGKYYEVQAGDRGMHILVGPPKKRIHGFTWEVFRLVMGFLFSDETTKRVVVEPDVRNEKIHVLNKKAGFVYGDRIKLPEKEAWLAWCTREGFEEALTMTEEKATDMDIRNIAPEQGVVAHLQGNAWQQANVMQVKKGIEEFAHELLLTPVRIDGEGIWGDYELTGEAGVYTFRARKLSLDHWYVEEKSLYVCRNGVTERPDAVTFILDFKNVLGLSEAILPTYLEEISSTLFRLTYMLTHVSPKAESLADAGYQEVEQAMTGGHPCFVANSGRIGFDAVDYGAYAPEAGSPIRLIWIAGHRDRTTYAGTEEYPYETLMEQELGGDLLERFENILHSRGLAPEEYVYMPVHPWQWYNKLAHIFAADIAEGKMVCLGSAPDEYLAQQSIRTFYNVSNPQKCYTKTALSILNMGFMRGLSPYYMGSTPAITEWVTETLQGDAYLNSKGFTMLGEVATVGYRHLRLEALGRTNAYNKMLAALWRESPQKYLKEGQEPMTMAALLHIDGEGNALLPELIKASGLDAYEWLSRYMDAYMAPLLHCFYAYDMVFMPHGENLILVMENHVPVKVFMKDITEEVMILSPDVALPERVRRLYAPTPDEIKLLSIFTDVFDCFFRFMSQILVVNGGQQEELFWSAVADCIIRYQTEHPHLQDKFEQYDLFAPEFARSCLNRLQLRNNAQMVDLSDPSAALQFFGTLKNPVAKYRPVAEAKECMAIGV
ncbi:GNAT family N-acetyltransferase [Roseivirga sp. BDSF3-8]|uniref:GNAT family N-acetyltransferase n=1 Tax=Roseivirga sp. BDSF3-8 TaxID=3241598 RepID=UPI003531FC73